MPWKNSWFQLAALVAVISGGLLIYDFGPDVFSYLMAAKSAPSSPVPATPPIVPPSAPAPPASPETATTMRMTLQNWSKRLAELQRADPDENIKAIIEENHLDDADALGKLDEDQSRGVVNRVAVKLVTASNTKGDPVATQLLKEFQITFSPAGPPVSPPSTPAPASTTPPPPVPPIAGQPWTNSLGMKFVPAGTDGVLFCVWDVRVKDYALYVKETGHDWSKPDFAQTENDPAVMVNWGDANAFCVWLTRTEQTQGWLRPNQSYRLPTDAEWSKAVGLSESVDGTPVSKSLANPTKLDFPWGSQWPPPLGAGNYAESLTHDGYAYTSPVGSFKPNVYGLYDMGGNVWQWCFDKYGYEYGDDKDSRVLRGASYDNIDHIDSSYREPGIPGEESKRYGFRVVVVVLP